MIERRGLWLAAGTVALAVNLSAPLAGMASEFPTRSPEGLAMSTSSLAACPFDPVATVADLRAALADANCTTINILPGTYLLTSSGSGELVITRGMTLRNTGGGRAIIDAGGASRVFFLKDVPAPVTIDGLTIQGGNFDSDGAGLYVEASSATVANSTISGNSNTSGKLGGGIFAKKATVVLENVTLSGNSADADGGGIYQDDGTLTLRNVTLAGNSAAFSGGGVYTAKGTLILDNTIVADNTQGSGAQLYNEGSTLTSNGHNLVEGGCTGCLPGDLTGDPNLGPLADNGGDSYTHALATGSQAVDAGLDLDAPATDQRDVTRPQGAASDIGAFEAVVNTVISSSADQTFWVGKAPTAVSPITVGEAGEAAAITAANDIRIRIPAGFNMSWDTLDVAAAITGGAAGKASGTVSYEDAGKTLVVDVTSDFSSGDTIVVSDLSFRDFTDASSSDNLELEIDNAGSVAAEDDKSIDILARGNAILSSEFDQSFRVGDPPLPNSTITVRDDDLAPVITAADDIRIHIPVGFNMSWDVGNTEALILGTAPGKVSGTVSYENGGRTLVLDVLTDFEPGDVITIDELGFTNFSGESIEDNLELEVENDGSIEDRDDKVIFVALILVTPDLHSSEDQFFSVGDPSTKASVIRITDDDVLPQVKAANDIRIRIPSDFNAVWDVSVTEVSPSGKARNKVSKFVSYEDGGKTLVLDVLTDFDPDDWININQAYLTGFTSASPPDRIELEVDNDGSVVAVDAFTKRITGGVFRVDVWPDTVRVTRLPSNGVDYEVDYTVSNIGSTTDSFDLLTSTAPGTAITVLSITGPDVTQGADPDSARLSNVPAADSRVVTVTYTVADVATGTIDTLTFLARSVSNPSDMADAVHIVTLARPEISVSEAVDPAGTQPPGTDLAYTVTITNTGSEEAVGLVCLDSLDPEVDLKLGSVSTSFPVGIGVTVDYSNDGGSGWSYTPLSEGCGAPAGYDRCVTHIRLSLQNGLGAAAPDNAGTMEFTARIQ